MKIGEFAKLSNATVKTLRYYDSIGLLKPDRIDDSTGYRIYSAVKLEQMRQIQSMKEIGFTLLEIRSFLAIDETEAKTEFVAVKRQEIECEKRQTEERLKQLDTLLDTLKEGGKTEMADTNYYVPFATDEEIRKLRQEFETGAFTEDAKIVKIYAGAMNFGAIDEDGKPYIWGKNESNQFDIPEDLPPVKELGIGAHHVVALDENGRLHGWGKQRDGELDFPDDLPEIVSLKVKSYHTRALTADGRVLSWGETNQGNQSFVPANMGTVKLLAASAYSATAVNTEDKIFAWGIFQEPSPAVPVEITAVAATMSGDFAYLGVDGKVYGDVKQRQMEKKYKPKPELSDIKKITAGNSTIAAVDGDGKVYIWGEYDDINNNAVVNVPENLPPVVDIAVGNYEVICLCDDGKLYAWGPYGVVVPPALDGFADGNAPVFAAESIAEPGETRDVYTFEQMCEAVQDRVKFITVKDDFTVTGESVHITNGITLIIDAGVTLTVNSSNFFIQKKLINNGVIKGGMLGRIIVYSEIEGSGEIITDSGFKVDINTSNIKNCAELEKYLAEDSVYSTLFYSNAVKTTVLIDRDMTIPRGKMLQLSMNCTLEVAEGVTLKIEGDVWSYTKPVIHGTVVGKITALDTLNERDIYSYEDLCEAVPQVIVLGKTYRSYNKLTIKSSLTIADATFRQRTPSISGSTMIIDEGVTLTIDSPDCMILGNIVNNGTITGTGRLYVDKQVTGSGRVDVSAGLRVVMLDPDASELGALLAEDTIYSEVLFINNDTRYTKTLFFPKRDPSHITIDRDLTVPKGKSVWFHINYILKVAEGATLKIDGKIETYNEPVIDGALTGDVTLIDTGTPRDVYTFAEFCDAARDFADDITVRGDFTIPFPQEHIQVQSLTVAQGVTLTGDNCNFSIAKKLINNGTITGTGRIHVNDRIDGGGVIHSGENLDIMANGIEADKISEYIAEDSVYTSVMLVPREEIVYTIDRDLTVPKNKLLKISNNRGTLKIAQGATLRIDGKVETYTKPVVEGTVIGDIDVQGAFPF